MATRIWLGGASGATTDWSNASNWSGGAVPVNGDDVHIGRGADNGTVYNIDAGLNQSAVTLTSLHIYDTYTCTIGTRASALQIGATNVYIHEPTGQSGNGSGRINLDLGSAQSEIVIYGSASSGSDSGLPPIRIVGTNAHNVAYVTGSAKVGFAAADADESCTLKELYTYASTAGSGPTVALGSGCTLTTIDHGAGTLTNLDNAVTTLTVSGTATYKTTGSGAHTTINLRGGTVEYRSSGTLTTATVATGALLDFSKDARAKTVTNLTLEKGAKLNLDNGNSLSITITNGIDLNNAGIEDVTITTWRHLNLALAAA